jgi:hypothetical protein
VSDAPPFKEFYLGLHRNNLANKLAVSATFVVPCLRHARPGG